MLIVLLGIMMLRKWLPPLNALVPIVLTLLPIIKFVMPEQIEKALFPMLVTLFEIVTLVTVLLLSNVAKPMSVTGRSSIMLGIVTAPPEPVYFVMVIVPLLVM